MKWIWIAASVLCNLLIILSYEQALGNARNKQHAAERALVAEMTRKPRRCYRGEI